MRARTGSVRDRAGCALSADLRGPVLRHACAVLARPVHAPAHDRRGAPLASARAIRGRRRLTTRSRYLRIAAPQRERAARTAKGWGVTRQRPAASRSCCARCRRWRPGAAVERGATSSRSPRSSTCASDFGAEPQDALRPVPALFRVSHPRARGIEPRSWHGTCTRNAAGQARTSCTCRRLMALGCRPDCGASSAPRSAHGFYAKNYPVWARHDAASTSTPIWAAQRAARYSRGWTTCARCLPGRSARWSSPSPVRSERCTRASATARPRSRARRSTR